MRQFKVWARTWGVAILGFAALGMANAQSYPNKPIRVIVPAGAGDSCDILVRLIGPHLTARLGQPLVVDNRAGSAGQLGLSLIKQAPPDGYTIGCGQGGNMVIVPLAYQKVAYDSKKDFDPIALMASNFLALLVSPNAPFNTVDELIKYGKANPGKITFGTNGEGAFLHFATEQFRLQAGFSYLHVPYKSMTAVFTEMLGNQIDATLASFISAEPLAASGKLKMLGIARSSRLPEYPKVPTLSESVPGFTSGGWFGMIAPAGTPKEIIQLLNREVNLALTLPDVRDRMKKLGLDIHMESPDYFKDVIQNDFERWGKLTKDIGFKQL